MYLIWKLNQVVKKHYLMNKLSKWSKSFLFCILIYFYATKYLIGKCCEFEISKCIQHMPGLLSWSQMRGSYHKCCCHWTQMMHPWYRIQKEDIWSCFLKKFLLMEGYHDFKLKRSQRYMRDISLAFTRGTFDFSCLNW